MKAAPAFQRHDPLGLPARRLGSPPTPHHAPPAATPRAISPGPTTIGVTVTVSTESTAPSASANSTARRKFSCVAEGSMSTGLPTAASAGRNSRSAARVASPSGYRVPPAPVRAALGRAGSAAVSTGPCYG